MKRQYPCQCVDALCGVCAGHCTKVSDLTLYHVDSSYRHEVRMCEDCANEAYESGEWSTEPAERDEVSDAY